ncbi:hypothetical protein COOONC_08243 [Cooperia oncophora]
MTTTSANIYGNNSKVEVDALHKEIARLSLEQRSLIRYSYKVYGSRSYKERARLICKHMVPALLEVLNICMDRQITPEISQAWERLYDIIGNMIGLQKGIRRHDM